MPRPITSDAERDAALAAIDQLSANPLNEATDAEIGALADAVDRYEAGAVAAARAEADILRRALTEVELLNRVLAHRAANHLAVVAGLVALERRRLGRTDADGIAALLRTVGRLRALAEVGARLNLNVGTATVAFAPLLRDLARCLAEGVLDPGRLTLVVEASETELPATHAAVLALAAVELVTNAAKHAYPDDRTGVVRVRFDRLAAGWTLAVEDDGPGLPDSTQAGIGLGLALVRGLAASRNGVVRLGPPPGACVTVELPFS